VRLPPGVRPPFDVYVNGVKQAVGDDYEIREGALLFDRPLVKEGRVAWWRWLVGAFGIGTYRQDDSVDVRYERDGQPRLATGLRIETVAE
jgi:hypothetical protein